MASQRSASVSQSKLRSPFVVVQAIAAEDVEPRIARIVQQRRNDIDVMKARVSAAVYSRTSRLASCIIDQCLRRALGGLMEMK